MEGEQKVDLPLDGELDIKSSDMLVPVSHAKFAHNRQRWQGHVLPSSLRYEHDGWAAGWDVYDIKYDAQSYTTEDKHGVMYKLRRYYYNDNQAYKVVVYSADDKYIGSFIYNAVTVTNSDNVQITRVSNTDESMGSVYNIAFDLNGKRVTCTYDLVTGAISCEDSAIAVTASISDNAKLRINAEDKAAAINVSIDKFNIPNAMYARIGTEETILGQFIMYDDTGYTWRNNTYNVVLHDNVISIKKGDTVLRNTSVTITDGVISSFDFSIVATAEAEYTASRSAVQIARVGKVYDTNEGKDISLGDYSDGFYYFKYKYDDNLYQATCFVNKLNAAKSAVSAEKPFDGMRMFIPVHVTAVYKRATNGNVSVKVFENDIDCTYKYNININGYGFSISPTDNALAKVCTPDDTAFLYMPPVVAADIVNAGNLDSLNYKHTRENSVDVYKYTAIRDTPAFDYYDHKTYILPYIEGEGDARYITPGIQYNAGYQRVSPRQPFINIFCDSTVTVRNDTVKASIIIDVMFYATATATIDTADNTIVVSNSTLSLDLCGDEQALFSYSISDVSGNTNNSNTMFRDNIKYKYSIRPRNISTLFFIPHTESDISTAYTPNAYAAYDSTVTEGKNIVAVPVTPDITNKLESDGTIPENYVKNYNLLDIMASVDCSYIRYVDNIKLNYTVNDTTSDDLSNILGSAYFMLDKPKVISDTSYTQDIHVQIPGLGLYGPFTIEGTSASVHIPAIQLNNAVYKGNLFTLKFGNSTFNNDTVTVTANPAKLVTKFEVLDTVCK